MPFAAKAKAHVRAAAGIAQGILGRERQLQGRRASTIDLIEGAICYLSTRIDTARTKGSKTSRLETALEILRRKGVAARKYRRP